MVMSITVIILMAVLNTVRGGAGGFIPIKALWVVAPYVGVVGYMLSGDPLWSACICLLYLFWALPAWGRWYDLHRLPEGFAREGKRPDLLERLMGWSRSDHVSMLMRHAVWLALLSPVMWLTSHHWVWLTISLSALGVLIVGAYEAGWRISVHRAIQIAEIATGALWGAWMIVSWRMLQ